MTTTTDKLAEALRMTIAREGDYLAMADEALAAYDAERATPAAHTPEPWRVDAHNPGDVNGPKGTDVALTLYAGMAPIEITGRETSLAAIERDEAEANARRIVACVNACAGTSTAALESGNYGIIRTRHEGPFPRC